MNMPIAWHECTDCHGRGYHQKHQEKNMTSCKPCGGGGFVPICPSCTASMTYAADRFRCVCGQVVDEDE